MTRLIKQYGVRRAMVLFGAAAVAAARGWDVLIGDDAYSRQGVWLWKRDLEAAGIDPMAVEWSGLGRKLGSDIGLGLQRATEQRKLKAAKVKGSTRRPASSA